VPWGRWEGAAPGYPAAAARLFNTSHNVEKTLTNSRPTHGRVKAKSGHDVLKARDIAGRAPQLDHEKEKRKQGPDAVARPSFNVHVPGKFSSTSTRSGW
jgi:hypothetical protein